MASRLPAPSGLDLSNYTRSAAHVEPPLVSAPYEVQEGIIEGWFCTFELNHWMEANPGKSLSKVAERLYLKACRKSPQSEKAKRFAALSREEKIRYIDDKNRADGEAYKEKAATKAAADRAWFDRQLGTRCPLLQRALFFALWYEIAIDVKSLVEVIYEAEWIPREKREPKKRYIVGKRELCQYIARLDKHKAALNLRLSKRKSRYTVDIPYKGWLALKRRDDPAYWAEKKAWARKEATALNPEPEQSHQSKPMYPTVEECMALIREYLRTGNDAEEMRRYCKDRQCRPNTIRLAGTKLELVFVPVGFGDNKRSTVYLPSRTSES